MEDQPADSGDLTTEGATVPEKPRSRWGLFGRRKVAPEAEPSEASEVEETPEAKPRPVGKRQRGTVVEDEPAEAPAEESSVDEETAEAAGESEESVEEAVEESTPEKAPVLVPFRPAGKRLAYVAAGAAVLFVGAAAFAGAMMQPYLSDRALVDTKLQVAQTSADAITTLWTYTPDNIDTLPNRAAKFLSNDFANQYRTFIDSIAPTNKQAQISNDTQVMGTAVESISPTEATAIVYTNSVSTSPVTKNIPSLRYLSYRLTLVRDGGDWRITKMPALTQLDLSPQL